MTEAEIRADERARCRRIIEDYAVAYVDKWAGITGQADTAKAHGWAILTAAAELGAKKP
jgi:hypothetical protein